MPKINLEFYKNNDIYIDKRLRFLGNISKAEADKNIDVVNNIVKFFLDPRRNRNIDAFNLDEKSEVLEVNASMGTVTKYLCDKTKDVTVIEFSRSNARFISDTCSDKNNLEIIVGNLKDIKVNKKFDSIIIWDTLEAANLFFEEENSTDTFIEYFKNILKPEGQIFFITENRYAIKNWCGAENERTLKKYDSLLGYPQTNSFNSYSKPELENIFNNHFKYIEFYYPIPDYYYPDQILTDSYMKLVEYKSLVTFESYVQGKTYLNQFNIVSHLLNIGKFDFFANSYLIRVSNIKPKKELLYSKGTLRCPTGIYKDSNKIYAEKYPLEGYAKQILEKMYNYYIAETKRINEFGIKNIKLAKCVKKKNGILRFEFAKGERLDLLLFDDIRSGSLEKVSEKLNLYKNRIYQLYPNRIKMDFSTNGMEKVFGYNSLKNVECVKNANIDMNLSNVFIDGDNYTIIDYDKICPLYVPINYVIYKGISSISFPWSIEELGLFNNEELSIYKNMLDCYYKSHRVDKCFL